jgi:hypothetical protein
MPDHGGRRAVMDINPRRDYDAGDLDMGPNDVRDTYLARQDDIALQAMHTSEIEAEEAEAIATPPATRVTFMSRVRGMFRRS